MRYISPIKIFGLSLDKEVNHAEIHRIRRRLLVDTELNANHTFAYLGQNISRDQIVKLSDELIDPVLYQFHYQICKSAELLNLLENFDGLFFSLTEPVIDGNMEFRAFVLPFYTEAVGAFIKKTVQHKAFNLLRLVLQTNKNLNIELPSNALFSVYEYLQQQIDELQSFYLGFKKFNLYRKQTELTQLTNRLIREIKTDWINLLPDSFQGQIDRLGIQLWHIAYLLGIYYRNPVTSGYLVNNLILQLRLSHELRGEMQELVNKSSIVQAGDDKSTSMTSTFIGLVVGITLFVLVFGEQNKKGDVLHDFPSFNLPINQDYINSTTPILDSILANPIQLPKLDFKFDSIAPFKNQDSLLNQLYKASTDTSTKYNHQKNEIQQKLLKQKADSIINALRLLRDSIQ